jgi:hypothetical protein
LWFVFPATCYPARDAIRTTRFEWCSREPSI